MIFGDIAGYMCISSYLPTASPCLYWQLFSKLFLITGVPMCVRTLALRDLRSVWKLHIQNNQQIERLWRDLLEGCVSFLYFLFYLPEKVVILDLDSEFDLAALHHVYVLIIQ